MILDDASFTLYGGQIGTSTPTQRNTAYRIAELQVRNHLGYPLIRETVTGQVPSYHFGENDLLKYSMVERIDAYDIMYSGTVVSPSSLFNSHIFGTCLTYPFVFLLDNELGLIDLTLLQPYRNVPGLALRVVYTAGLETGTFNTNEDAMMALSMAAQIVLNELTVPGLTEARIGVQEFTNMKYTEKRYKLGRSVFGSSAAANYIVTLLSRMKRPRVGRI